MTLPELPLESLDLFRGRLIVFFAWLGWFSMFGRLELDRNDRFRFLNALAMKREKANCQGRTPRTGVEARPSGPENRITKIQPIKVQMPATTHRDIPPRIDDSIALMQPMQSC